RKLDDFKTLGASMGHISCSSARDDACTHLGVCIMGLRCPLDGTATALSAAETNTEDRLHALEEQNQILQSQVQRQQDAIEALSRDLANIRAASSNQQSQVDQMKADLDHPAEPPSSVSHVKFGNVHLSGE